MKTKKKQKSQATHRRGRRSGGQSENRVEIDRPRGEREGSGPLNQEGEGNRQNDQAAELEEEQGEEQ
jgi:hypothetical protein